MRINRYVAAASYISRRKADAFIKEGRVKVNGLPAITGQEVTNRQIVTLDNIKLTLPNKPLLIKINKPRGYVVSRDGQGAPTIYSILQKNYQNLNPIGRLDKDSSGLLLLSNDGQIINNLAHPRYNKDKVYEVKLNKSLTKEDLQLLKNGIDLIDGPSRLEIKKVNAENLVVSIKEGRNRQIRRTFDTIGYQVISLHRIAFGKYRLGNLKLGQYEEVKY
ncbi:MAG: pseudouridine synthase [Candidatus Saccharimonadales bacterium]